MRTEQPRALITGIAGFIASHVTDLLLEKGYEVFGVDNLKLGRPENLSKAMASGRVHFVYGDINEASTYDELKKIFEGRSVDVVWHLAANSDISAGVANPEVDFRDTFLTTYNVLRWMRELSAKKLIFASTSAVYGDHGERVLTEDSGPLFPISNYGAMKLASEGSISAALESYLEQVWIYRFPNVVGSRSTHGALYDFIQKLKKTPDELVVLGDGTQQKEYLHVSELVSAMWLGFEKAGARLNYFNVGASDAGARVSDIAAYVVKRLNPKARIRYTGGNRGWVGDVPRFRYSIEKIIALGWRPRLSSVQAVERAVDELALELVPQGVL